LSRWVGLLASLILVVCLFLTLSRGAWIGVIVALVAYCVFRNRRVVFAVLLVLGILGGLIASSDKLYLLVKSRDPYSQYVKNFRNNTRVEAYTHVAQIFPLNMYWGSGIGTYRDLAKPIGSRLNTPDNMYLMRLVETGLLGLLVWIFLFVKISSILSPKAVQGKGKLNPPSEFPPLLFAGLVGFWFDMVVFDALYFPVTRMMFWILLGIGISYICEEQGRNLDKNRVCTQPLVR